MYSEETFNIAVKLWRDPAQMDKLITMLQGIKALRQKGLSYSYQDFDVKQNLAAHLHGLTVESKS